MVSRRSVVIGGGVAAGLAGLGWAGFGGTDYEAIAREQWSPRPPGDAEYLVHYATRAANSHNTQPWLFSVSETEAVIHPDFTRATPAADPDNHHLWASLGCAAENLALAAAAMGRPAEVVAEGTEPVRISLGRGDAARDPLFDAILARQCTRAEYDGRAVPPADLAALEATARVPGCGVLLVTDRARIDAVRDLIVEANTLQVEDPAFARELRDWIRFNAGDAVARGDGLYSACSGNPTLPGWLGPIMFGMVFGAKAENAKVTAQVASSAGFAVFVSDRDDPAHWVRSGRSYQRFALQATALGIRHAFLNQAVEVAGVRPRLAGLLGIGDRRPDLVVRFGYGPRMPRSLRRPLAEVMRPA